MWFWDEGIWLIFLILLHFISDFAAYDTKPFYQQFWFLIIVALTAVIFIIVIIAVFLVLGRNKKKRGEICGQIH
jgi:heme/copper-type cytochrome/quinol oxidase subunit 2